MADYLDGINHREASVASNQFYGEVNIELNRMRGDYQNAIARLQAAAENYDKQIADQSLAQTEIERAMFAAHIANLQFIIEGSVGDGMNRLKAEAIAAQSRSTSNFARRFL